MFQNNIDFIKNAVIQNDNDTPLDNFTIFIKSDVDFFEPIKYKCDGIGSNKIIDVTKELNRKVILNQSLFLSITEKIKSVVTLEVLINDVKKPLISEIFEIEAFPFNYWPGVNSAEMIASFITPNAESVKLVRSLASEQLKKWNKDPSLEGYQKNDRKRIVDLAAAVYATLRNKNINYTLPPVGFENEGQRIRFIDDILTDYEGTCIDLSIGYASVLESIGINTIIFITKNHAFAGFWLTDNCMPNIVNYENNNFINFVKNNEMMLVECTTLTNSSNCSFDTSNDLALDELKKDDDFICAIDVKKSRSVYRPLPIRKKLGDVWTIERSDLNEFMESPKEIGIIYGDIDERNITREDKWKRELLDISNRNNLINMKMGTKVIPLMTTAPSELQKLLISGEKLTIVEKPQEWDGGPSFQRYCFESETYISNYVAGCFEDLSRNRLRTPLSYVDLLKIEKSIFSLSNKELEESGCNALFVGLGLMKWRDEKSDIFRYSPLILIPVSIKKTRNNDYVIELLDEDTVFNITIAEKLRQEFDILIPNFDPLTTNDDGCVNIEEVFQNVTRAINGKGWTILNSCVLGIFSFNQYVMWKDLDNNMERLKANPIVESLINGVTYPKKTPIEYDSDPCGLCLTMPADSSQIFAVRAASEGKTFVMHGPPGTGKSQTITNIISDSLCDGKTVLFVAEKRAALEVVQKRLKEIGIGDCCLELHSNKTEKSKVMEQLRRAINFRYSWDKSNEMNDIENEIETLQFELDEYVSELHEQRICNLSVYDCICRYENYHSNKTVDFKIPSARVSLMKPGDDITFTKILSTAHAAYENVHDLKNTIFQYINFDDASVSATEDIIDEMKSVCDIKKQIKKEMNCLEQIGLSFTSNPLHLLEYFDMLGDNYSKLFACRNYDEMRESISSLKSWFELLKNIIDSSHTNVLENNVLLQKKEEIFNDLTMVNHCLDLLQDDPTSINDSIKKIHLLTKELYKNHIEMTKLLDVDSRLDIDSLFYIINNYDYTLTDNPKNLSPLFEEAIEYLKEVKNLIKEIGSMKYTNAQLPFITKNLIGKYSNVTSISSNSPLSSIEDVISWTKSISTYLDKTIENLKLKTQFDTVIDENYLTKLSELIEKNNRFFENIDVEEIYESLERIDTSLTPLISQLKKYSAFDYDLLTTLAPNICTNNITRLCNIYPIGF